jgi:peptidoglycan hydrolase FlgJ
MEVGNPGSAAYDRASGEIGAYRAENLKRRAQATEERRLRDVCEQFEAIFVKQMLTSMRRTVNKTGLVDGGMAEEIFEDMLYDEYATSIAKTTRLGISEMLYKELSQAKPVISP